MEWIEVKVITKHEAIEALTAVLLDCGVEGTQIDDDIDLKKFLQNNYLDWDYVDEELANKTIEDTIITFYLSRNLYGMEMLKNIESALERALYVEGVDFGSLELILKDVNDEDWSNNWKKYYKPFRIGEKVVVRPIWEDFQGEDSDIIFTIDPGSAFGTGLHQTTQLCIESLEKIGTDDKEILDLGCGSGILSIVSLLLGGKSATAVDIDKNAVDNALKNGEINKVQNYRGLFGDVLNDDSLVHNIKKVRYDIVVANIVADVIISLTPSVKEFIKNDGIFISSGIIKGRLDEVLGKFKEEGFEVLNAYEKDEWVCVVAKVIKG